MDKISGKLTVYFEEPFWVGVFELVFDGNLSVCKITFGAEPKEYEVLDCVLKHYCKRKPSPAVEIEKKQTADNPKRRQRNAKKLLKNSGTGTKAQQAFQMQREELKLERRQMNKEQKEAEKLRQFQMKQQKRKEKHKGH